MVHISSISLEMAWLLLVEYNGVLKYPEAEPSIIMLYTRLYEDSFVVISFLTFMPDFLQFEFAAKMTDQSCKVQFQI